MKNNIIIIFYFNYYWLKWLNLHQTNSDVISDIKGTQFNKPVRRQANNCSRSFAKLDRHYIVTMFVLLLLIRNIAKNLKPITKHSNTTPKCSTPKLLFIVNTETRPFLLLLLLLLLLCRATKLLFFTSLACFSHTPRSSFKLTNLCYFRGLLSHSLTTRQCVSKCCKDSSGSKAHLWKCKMWVWNACL